MQFFFLSLFFGGAIAMASDCSGLWPETVEDQFKNSKEAVLGLSMEDSKPSVDGKLKTLFTVVHRFKGGDARTFEVLTERPNGANLGMSFKKDGLYIVLATLQGKGALTTSGCSAVPIYGHVGISPDHTSRIAHLLKNLSNMQPPTKPMRR